MPDKYVVLRVADIQQFLQKEEREKLLGMIQKINANRQAGGKSVGDNFWPLNMKDKYALLALEAYYEAIEADASADKPPETTKIAQDARAFHSRAVMNFTHGFPT